MQQDMKKLADSSQPKLLESHIAYFHLSIYLPATMQSSLHNAHIWAAEVLAYCELA